MEKINQDKTFEDKKIIIEYNNQYEATILFEDPKLFIEEFPNKLFLFENTLYADNNYKVKEIKPKDKLPNAYFELEKLDNIFKKISLNKKPNGNRSYAYEIFGNKKIVVINSIDYEHALKLDKKNLDSLNELYIKFINMPKAQIELHKTFLIKAIETIFKNKDKITFNDIIDNWNEICAEYELLHIAYLDTLNTNILRFDYQKKLQEFNEKLHSVMSDIQNKAIIPPIAIILAFTNIYEKSLKVKEATLYLLILFIIIIFIYQYNQVKFLDEYKNTISKWEVFYKRNMNKQYNIFKEQYNQLYNRIKQIKIAFYINISLLIGMLVIFLIFVF